MKKITIIAFAVLLFALDGRGEIFTLTGQNYEVQSIDLDSFSSGTQIYLNSFDTSLGHLLKIAFTWTLNSEIASASLTNQNADPVTDYTFDLSSTLHAYQSSGSSSGSPMFSSSVYRTLGGGVLGSGDTYAVSGLALPQNTDHYSMSSLVIDPYTFDNSNLAAFMGKDAVPIYLTNTFAITPPMNSDAPSWQWSASGSTSGHLDVYYAYVPATPPVAAVPEPHSRILGGIGLAGMSVLLLRRGTKKPLSMAGYVSERAMV